VTYDPPHNLEVETLQCCKQDLCKISILHKFSDSADYKLLPKLGKTN